MKETPADEAVRKSALENSGARLGEHVEALERFADELADLKERVKERYALIKVEGYDLAAVKLLLRRRDEGEDGKQARMELEAIVGVYWSALEAVTE